MRGCSELVVVSDVRGRRARQRAVGAAAGLPGTPVVVVDQPDLCVVATGRDGAAAAAAWTVGARRFLLHGTVAGPLPDWMYDERLPLEQLAHLVTDGRYNLLVRDGRRLLVSPDLFGFQPLLVGEHAGRLVLASQQRAVLSALGMPPRMDVAGVAQTLVRGTSLTGGSLFEGVRCLPVETAALLAQPGLRLLHRQPLVAGAVERQAPAERVESCEAVLAGAAARWLADVPAPLVSLSGGLDSRLALGYAQQLCPDPASASWGLPAAGDAVVAARLAGVAGIPHESVAVPATGHAAAELVAGALQAECVAAGHLPFYRRPWLAHLADQRRPVVHGMLADTLSGQLTSAYPGPADMLARPAEQATEQMREWATGRASDGLVAAARPAFRPLLREHIGAATADLWRETPGELTVERLTRHGVALLNRRKVTSLSVHAAGTVSPVLTPFYTRSAVEYFLRLPVEDLMGRRLFRRVLASRFPRLAAVPEAGTGRRVWPRDGLPGLADRLRFNRHRWRIQPSARPPSSATVFRPVVIRHLPTLAGELRGCREVMGDLLDLSPLCDRWDHHDLAGVTPSEAMRLVATAVLLRDVMDRPAGGPVRPHLLTAAAGPTD